MSLLHVASSFGNPSETFIRLHARKLSPEESVFLSSDEVPPPIDRPWLGGIATWQAPSSFLDRGFNYAGERLRRILGYRLTSEDTGALNRFVNAYGVSVALVEYLDVGSRYWRNLTQMGVRVFVHAHGSDATRLTRDFTWRLEYRRMAEGVSGLIAPSQYLKDRLTALGIPDRKIFVNYNGIETDRYFKDEVPGLRVVMIGRLVEKKAPHLSIKAFAACFAEFPDLELHIIGEGPLRAKCEKLVSDLGLDESVVFHGVKDEDDVRKQLSVSDVFLQHSVVAKNGDTEGFGLSIVEAMASGVPVVVTRHNGFVETVCDGETGFLVDEHDVVGMADALLALLRDRNLRDRMGRRAQESVRLRFDEIVSINGLRDIMELGPKLK